MSNSRKPPQRSRRFGHALAASILAILPLLAIAGVLAPNLVVVQVEEEAEEQIAPSPVYQPVRLAKRPLLIPRDYSAGFVPEILDLEQLFIGSEYRADPAKRLTRLPTFPHKFGDVIVFDDVDTYIGAKIFKDVLDLSLVADTSHLEMEYWAVIPPLWPAGNLLQFDDFTGGNGIPPIEPLGLLLAALIAGGGPVIPEPSTGLMFGMGLVGLVLKRRRDQRQPAIS